MQLYGNQALKAQDDEQWEVASQNTEGKHKQTQKLYELL